MSDGWHIFRKVFWGVIVVGFIAMSWYVDNKIDRLNVDVKVK